MQKIQVKQFKAIKEMEIEFDRALFLIGEQASGKSTISKLIYFFKFLRQEFIDLIYENLNFEQEDMVNLFWKRIGNNFYNFFGSTRHLPNFEISYFYAENKHIKLSLKSDKTLQIHFSPNNFYQEIFFGDAKDIANSVQQFSEQKSAYDRRMFQTKTMVLDNYVNQLFEDKRVPLFIPAGRNITVNYPEQFKLYGNLESDLIRQQSQEKQSADLYLMMRFLEQTERIKKRFESNDFEGLIADRSALGQVVDKELSQLLLNNIQKILKGKYGQDQYGEKLFIDNSNYVYFRNASSGQQEVIRILQDIFLILLDEESSFRVIEEPEAHLYPMAQKQLLELIAIVLNKTDTQFIITTHSPYILSIINNLLFATRVKSKNEQVSDKITAIIPELCWFNPKTTNGYFLKDGYCEPIFDESTGLIGQNYLDKISEDLGDDFEELYQIHAKAFT